MLYSFKIPTAVAELRNDLMECMMYHVEKDDYKSALDVWSSINVLMTTILQDGLYATTTDVPGIERGEARERSYETAGAA